MNTDSLNPQDTLEHFFLLERAFAFHDQTRPQADYTYGSAAPQAVQDTPAGRISALHLLTSPAGGVATFIAPNMPVDTPALESYIRQHFIPSPGDINLVQWDVRQSLFLRFIRQPESASYDVAFDNPAIPLTHSESTLLDSAIRGDKNKVYLLAGSAFIVSSRVTARLEGDWGAFLTLAMSENIRQPDAIALLLNQQIDAGALTMPEQFENTPSEQTREQVRESLVNTASLLIAKTLSRIHSPDEIPDDIDYDIRYSNSVPQRYLLTQQQDIAVLLKGLSPGSIITFSPTPLPEPDRPDKPVPTRECVVSLGFNPSGFKIMSIELSYANTQTPMPWPAFSPVTLKTASASNEITLKVTFADYSSYEKRLQWQDAIVLTPQDLGFFSVLFEAEHLKSSFKSIEGTATFLPADQAKKQSFRFAFSDQQWLVSWWINAQSAELNGRIEYSWSGSLKTLLPKTYDSGRLQATVSPIKLQYKK